jgi:hypothetical protein
MAGNDLQTLPAFASLDEMVDFFDTHDLGDYLDQMPEAHFDVNLQRRTYLVAIDEDIIRRLAEIARQEQVPAEALVNRWLEEKISSYSEQALG